MRTLLLNELQKRIASVAERDRPSCGRLEARWGATLALGVAHEWFADSYLDESGHRSSSDRSWFPPLCLLADLAASAVAARHQEGLVLWIGRRCLPYGRMLARWPVLLRASVLVDAPDDAARLWLIDIAARSPSVAAVIADGHGLRVASTRRIQLAAACGGGLCMLARPPEESRLLSACAARWRVSPEVTTGFRPRWSVGLIRDKTSPAMTDRSPRWLVEWSDEAGAVGVGPRMVGAAGEAADDVRFRASA
jgi:hypothetical protein